MLRNVSAAALGLVFAAVPALADMTQPFQSDVAIWAYPQAETYCPSGLQPIRLGGVVCCGKPTHTGYAEPPAQVHKNAYRKAHVAYGKGADDYVAYSKSPGETE